MGEAGDSRSAHLAQNEGENTVQAIQGQDEGDLARLKPASLPQKEQPLKDGDEPDKKPTGKLSSRQRRRENRQKQNAANEQLKKEIFRGDGEKGAASSLILDKSFKEKLIEQSKMTKMLSSSISNSRKEKQENSSSNVDGGDNNPLVDSGRSIYPQHSNHHKYSAPNVEKKSMQGLQSRILKETPEGASHAIMVTDKGELDLLARAQLKEDNRYNPLESDQHKQKQLFVEKEEIEDEINKKLESLNQQGNRHIVRTAKGKSIMINTKEEKRLQNEKQKEEEKMLRLEIEIKNAAKQRWDEDQSRKEVLDNMLEKNKEKNEKIANNLRHTGHGEASGNSGSAAERGIGKNLATNSPIANPSAPAASNISADEAEFLLKVEANEKFIQIKNILKNLKEKLNELTELENNWLSEKIILFRAHIKNRNPNEKEKEILELINNLVKQKELLKKEEKKKADLKKDVKNMKEEISKSKTSKNKNRKELKNLENKLNIAENNLSKMEKPKKGITKKIDELEISLLKEFIEMKEKLETDEIKMIQEKMKEPLKYIWTAYELVLIIINKQWQKPYVMNYFTLKRPYHYISALFGITISAKADDGIPADIIEFNYIMRIALLKMLRHHNFYSTFNPLAYEKLKCFDVFSEKMSWLIKESQKYALSENHAEHLEIFGKFFKEELNKSFHDVFHFNMVGLDKLPDVWDQMVLDGIGRLSEWLPKDRQQNFNEIWVQLSDYYKEEKRNLKWLSQYENDKLAMKLLDLFPDEEYVDEEIRQQISIIKELSEKINSARLSDEVNDFISNTFGHIEKWIQSINMLLKIQKRENYALPYLKSMYDKYWYIIYKDRSIIKMNYRKQFIQSFCLMLIFSQFDISMEGQPRRSILNPNAPEFLPQLRPNQNAPQFHSSEELDENKAHSLLPKSLLEEFDIETNKDDIAENIDQSFTPRQIEEAINNAFIPKLTDFELQNTFQLEKNKVDPSQQEEDSPTKLGIIPDKLLTEENENDQSIKSGQKQDKVSEKTKENIKDELNHGQTENSSFNENDTKNNAIVIVDNAHQREKVETSIHFTPKLSDKEEKPKVLQNKDDELKSALTLQKEHPNEGEDQNKKPAGKLSKRERRRENKQRQNAANEKLKKEIFNGVDEKGVSAATSKALESNFKETWLSGKGMSKSDKEVSAKSQQSFSSSSSTKEKLQQYSQKPEQQSSNRSGGVNSPRGDSGSVSPSQSIHHKQQPSIIEKKFVLGIPSHKLKESLEGSSDAIKETDTHKKLAEITRFDPLQSDQQQKQKLLLVKEEEEIIEKVDDEHKELLERTNKEGSQHGQYLKSKGKSAVIDKKEIKRIKNEKEREEEKLLREESKNAAKQQREQDQLRKKAFDKHMIELNKKEEELQHNVGLLATSPTDSATTNVESKNTAKQRREEEQLRKKAIDIYMKKLRQRTSQLANPQTDSAITHVSHDHGETIGSSSSNSGNVTKKGRFFLVNEPVSFKVQQEPNISAVEAESKQKTMEKEGLEKFKRIEDILKNLQEKLKEIDDLELNEKIEHFRAKIKNRIPNEKEKEISGFIAKLDEANAFLENEKITIVKLTKEVEVKRAQLILLNNNTKDVKKLSKKLDNIELEILDKKKKDQNVAKSNEEMKKLLRNILSKELKEEKKPETEEMNAIQDKMTKLLNYLWTAYNLVLNILNQHFKQPDVKNQFALNKPYYFISPIFAITLSVSAIGKDEMEFNNTMMLTLEKMLAHQNIYRYGRGFDFLFIFNSTWNPTVHEKLNCFDVLSEKMRILEGLMNNNRPKNPGQCQAISDLETFGKFFKQELNQTFHEVFRFIIVGIDQIPDVWDKMVMDGISRLSEWLPKNRRLRFNEIWVQLYEYYEKEKSNLEWLIDSDNDKRAERLLDLFPNEECVEEKLSEQSQKINELKKGIISQTKFSNEIKNFMTVLFANIRDLIQSKNMLLKIQKREKNELLFLKSIYQKYWYMLYKRRFIHDFAMVSQYNFGEKNQIENKDVKKLMEKIGVFYDRQENGEYLKYIKSVESGIYVGIMQIMDEIDKVIVKNSIWVRAIICKNDKDFMDSIAEENPNKDEYIWRKSILNDSALNPNAEAFYPRGQFISTLPEIHSHSEQQITNEDIKHEALSILPEFLFDWEKDDKIDDVNQQEREEYHFNPQREEAGSSQGTHLSSRRMEEAGINQGTHLNPQMQERGSSQDAHLISPRAREEAGLNQGVNYSPRNIEEAASIQEAHLNLQREEAGNNQGAQLSPRVREEAGSNKGTHLSPRAREEAGSNKGTHLNPKLNEGEKENPVQIERNKVNPANTKINVPLKFGSIPENFLTSEHEKIEPKKLGDNKHLKVLEGVKDEWHHEHFEKFSMDKAGTLGHEISKGNEGEGVEKSERIHEEESPKITQSASDSDSNSEKKIENAESPKSVSSSQKDEQQQPREEEASNKKPATMAISGSRNWRRKERKQQQEAAKSELKNENFGSDGKVTTSSQTLDKSNKEKLIDPTATEIPSSSSSTSSRKEKQQSTIRSGRDNSPSSSSGSISPSHSPKAVAKIQSTNSSSKRKGKQLQQQHSQQSEQQKSFSHGGKNSPREDTGSVSPSHSIRKDQLPKVEKKSPLEIPSRTMKITPEDVDELNLLASAKLTDDNRYDLLKSKELSVEGEKEDDSHKEQLESSRIQQESRQSAQSKGKSKIVNAKVTKKSKNDKEKEEEKLLRDAIVANTKEKKKLQIEEEKEETKMLREGIDNEAKQRWVQEQLRTFTEDLERKNKELAKSLGHSRLLPHHRLLESPPESIATKLLSGNREASGSASGGSNLATNSRISILPVSGPLKWDELKKSFTVEAKLLPTKKNDAEGEEKFKQIKNILEMLQKKLSEIDELEKELKKEEKIWLVQKSNTYMIDIVNNKKEKRNEIEGKLFKNAESYLNLFDQIQWEKEELAELNKEIEEFKKKNPRWNEGKVAEKLMKMEMKLSIHSRNVAKFEKESEIFAKILLEEYKKIYGTEELKTQEKNFQEKMVKPLKYLWTAYNLVLKILNEHWSKADVRNKLTLKKRPYHFISAFFGIAFYAAGEDREEFNKTMKATLEQMLIYRNIYSNIGPIKGELVHEKLNCFDELSQKMNWLTEERKKNGISENHVKHMETFGKFFKEELNQTFHEVFRFIMVGIDQLPDVWDQMVLDGITRLSNWLPKDRQEGFNEIWVQLYEYYDEEKRNLKWLSRDGNDKMAMKIFDLFPHEEYVDKRLKEQLPKIWDLSKLTKEKFSSESGVVRFMMVAFGHIIRWITSINLLLKIEKREKDSLLYLKSVYDKYWFMVYYNRFNFHFLYARQYYISREKNRTQNLDISEEKLPDIGVVKTEEVEPIFKQIEANEPSILDEMMKVIETIEEIVKRNKMVERFLKYQNDKDFLDSIFDENANMDEYERRVKMLTAKNGDAGDNEKGE